MRVKTIFYLLIKIIIRQNYKKNRQTYAFFKQINRKINIF